MRQIEQQRSGKRKKDTIISCPFGFMLSLSLLYILNGFFTVLTPFERGTDIVPIAAEERSP